MCLQKETPQLLCCFESWQTITLTGKLVVQRDLCSDITRYDTLGSFGLSSFNFFDVSFSSQVSHLHHIFDSLCHLMHLCNQLSHPIFNLHPPLDRRHDLCKRLWCCFCTVNCQLSQIWRVVIWKQLLLRPSLFLIFNDPGADVFQCCVRLCDYCVDTLNAMFHELKDVSMHNPSPLGKWYLVDSPLRGVGNVWWIAIVKGAVCHRGRDEPWPWW